MTMSDRVYNTSTVKRSRAWLGLYRPEFQHHAVGLMEFIRDVAPIEGGCA